MEKDSESDSESEPEKVVMKPSLTATTKKDSESDSESEPEKVMTKPSIAATTEKDSESDSESEPEKVVTRAATTEKDSKSSSQSGFKEDEGGVSVKRVKVLSVERKPYFQRVWVEDYEMHVLQGDDPAFVKARDHKTFDLCKLVWGAPESAVISNGKKSKSGKSKNVESSSLVGDLLGFDMDELGAEKGVSRLSSEDKKIFEEQLKALKTSELNFHLEKAGFLHQLLRKVDETSR
ncbi:PREDICTED: probable transcription factor At1g11510 [Camelina sativa]|uniref:Probable transcription factor At1g11510 n=1 Tax=Camelina sativa TaxID=90675 RepID=A0ABM0XSB3_CAMSA|nr:PREDICTED: probable transcription factor At1g11510 [Camelina sativa]